MTATAKNWFEVDKEGLAKILERRGKEFLLYELISNAWDTKATEVEVSTVVTGRGQVSIVVRDDDPQGFTSLSHAFTLFAESGKKGDAELRGRFNLGEKLVLAMCNSAEISTTTGTVYFDKTGRRVSKSKRERGSQFIGTVRMTLAELDDALKKCRLLIGPARVKTTINGERLTDKLYLDTFEATLPTEIADAEGNLRRSERKCSIGVYEVLPDETAMIYEMGIPIVETGDQWHVNIEQKVPLNTDRDNVTPAYLSKVRALVLNAMSKDITPEMAAEQWVRDAAAQPIAAPEAVAAVMDARFGQKRVAYDPSDPEANKRAVAAGYTVVHGGSMSAGEWENVRRDQAILPAGKVTPSPKPFHPGGELLKIVNPDDYTPAMRLLVDYARGLHERLIGGPRLVVQLVDDAGWGFGGTYDKCEAIVGPMLRINLASYAPEVGEEIDRLLLHEFAHHECSDHLDKEFAEAGFRLGARLKRFALNEPEFFKKFEVRT